MRARRGGPVRAGSLPRPHCEKVSKVTVYIDSHSTSFIQMRARRGRPVRAGSHPRPHCDAGSHPRPHCDAGSLPRPHCEKVSKVTVYIDSHSTSFIQMRAGMGAGPYGRGPIPALIATQGPIPALIATRGPTPALFVAKSYFQLRTTRRSNWGVNSADSCQD